MQSTTNAEWTGHLLLTHKACGHTTRTFVGQYFFSGYAADGKTTVKYGEHRTACCGCGKALRTECGTRLMGVYSERQTCGARCLNARGPWCECPCNGANHGGAYDA